MHPRCTSGTINLSRARVPLWDQVSNVLATMVNGSVTSGHELHRSPSDLGAKRDPTCG